MKLLITKFFDNSLEGSFTPNYFNKPYIVDYITIEDIMIDGFPLFSDTLTKDDDLFTFQAGEFDLNISLLSKAKSFLNKSVEEFFKLDKIYILRIAIEENEQIKSFGFIDLESIEFNYNVNQNGLILSFTVLNSEKEWSDFLASRNFGDLVYDVSIGSTFEMIMPNFAFNSNVVLSDSLDFSLKVLLKHSFLPKLSEIKKAFNNTDAWTVFKGWVKGFGFMFKILPPQHFLINQWCYPVLKLFWRSEGIFSNEIQLIEHIEGVVPNLKNNVLIYYGKYHDNGLYGKDPYECLVNSSCYDGSRFTRYVNRIETVEKGSPWFPINLNLKEAYLCFEFGILDFTFLYPENTNVIDIDRIPLNIPYNAVVYYFFTHDDYYLDEISSPRMWVNTETIYSPIPNLKHIHPTGFKEIINALLPFRYDFLASRLKKRKELKIVYNHPFDISSYHIVNFENTSYWIDEVNNVDLRNSSADIKLIEI